MAKPQRKTLFIAVLVAVAAFGVIGPLGSRWLGPREASADSSTPILIEDPDGSVFTIPPDEDPEAIADEFGTEPILIVDGPEAFTTSIPEEETTTTPAAPSSSSTTAAVVSSETTQAAVTTTSTEPQADTATTKVPATTTTSPVQLDTQSAALVTEESSSAGLLIMLSGLLIVTASGAMFGWRWRRGSTS